MFASTGGYNMLAFNLIFSRQEKRYRKYYPPQVVTLCSPATTCHSRSIFSRKEERYRKFLPPPVVTILLAFNNSIAVQK
jgi:hypothetical protein